MFGAEDHLHGEGSPQLPEKPAYMPNPESQMDNMELKTIAELAYQYWVRIPANPTSDSNRKQPPIPAESIQ